VVEKQFLVEVSHLHLKEIIRRAVEVVVVVEVGGIVFQSVLRK
jgi:hypothetical protein